MKKVARILIAATTLAAALAFAWTTPVNIGSNVNTSEDEVDPAITADGRTLYYSCGRAGGYGSWDIWQSVYSGGVWQTPTNLGPNINNTYADLGPAHWVDTYPELYYYSNRPGTGGDDIWFSLYQGGSWQPAQNWPQNYGADNNPCVIGSPKRLFFCSDRPGGYGNYDIWMSTWTGSAWGTPVNLGSGVNTSGYEYAPSVTADGTKMYFHATRTGGLGGLDIYVATYSGGAWGNVQNLGAPVNTSSNDTGPSITPDNYRLYFYSNRSGGYGSYDIYYSDNTATVAPTSLGRVKALFR